jgi:hypothetical protein
MASVTNSASAELPCPAALTDECGDVGPRPEKNDGHATGCIELKKHAVERFPDQYAIFHFQNGAVEIAPRTRRRRCGYRRYAPSRK